ncbi:MAG: c-type cytochrome [Betaproteobacteria bacterium]|nr:c-type cytochrome [Betaproteobacteria bacterium]
MKTLTALALAATLGVSGTALASADLAAQHKCNTCHAMDKKMMGPTWKDIAAKNKGQKDAEKAVAEAIVKGSKNKYGKVPMPPQPKAQADAAALAKWILSL